MKIIDEFNIPPIKYTFFVHNNKKSLKAEWAQAEIIIKFPQIENLDLFRIVEEIQNNHHGKFLEKLAQLKNQRNEIMSLFSPDIDEFPEII